MSNKFLNTNKKNHTEKILNKIGKQPGKQVMGKIRQTDNKTHKGTTLGEQYSIIRNDLMKLKEDLSIGFDLAKGLVDRRKFMSKLIKTK